ncbi:hypothetical protein PanWU01x14_126400 [Parasponia andersonii]|uniref:Uncharacterized protein n=1 Tax=Parasponia andersonii TaxID=3476 RepID=A0A2P5CST6_PARAD|nr:hypothetical protein PanWU01x14_126400 [Parasponia andersonii]
MVVEEEEKGGEEKLERGKESPFSNLHEGPLRHSLWRGDANGNEGEMSRAGAGRLALDLLQPTTRGEGAGGSKNV